MSAFEPSLVRRALDELLRLNPHLDLVSIDWQVNNSAPAFKGPEKTHRLRPLVHAGPWVQVQLGQPSESWDDVPAWALWRFAIWKRTGAVHTVGSDGAVSDDPIFQLEIGGEAR